jgi:hypothetical protein
LITKLYRKLKKLNSQKSMTQCRNELNRAFSKEEVQMAKKHLKKCSASLTIKEMQVKTMLRYHLAPVGMAIIKNTTKKVGEDVEEENRTLIHCW